MEFVDLLSLFTLGFSSLFPLINPFGTSLIVSPYFAGSPLSDRKSQSRTIVIYGMVLGLCALLLGSWVLRFMGISIATTQLAGGLIIARMGLGMLNAQPSKNSSSPSGEIKDSLFYPITFPLTIGPGAISVLIALSAHAHTPELTETLVRNGVLAASLMAVMLITYFCLLYSERAIHLIGPQGSVVLSRLMAFLVFCIGLQVAITGLTHSFPKLFQ